MIGNLKIRLSKEFETLGFFISDHPLNQYKIFNQYNIVDYNEFEKDKNLLSSNIACTVLKVQEKKQAKRKFLCYSKTFRFKWYFLNYLFFQIFLKLIEIN